MAEGERVELWVLELYDLADRNILPLLAREQALELLLYVRTDTLLKHLVAHQSILGRSFDRLVG